MRRSSPLIDACEAMKRWASSASDISRLNSATGRGWSLSSATFSAMFVTSADLPIDGRAARTMRLPGWKPPVISSRSAKPDGVPVSVLALGGELLPLVDLDVEDVADLAEVLLAVVVGDLEDRALGALDEVARLAVVVVDAGLDLVGRREQPAQERVLLDDAAVAAQGADAGAAAVSASISAWPPASSSLPRERRCSVTVRTSIGSLPRRARASTRRCAVALAVEVLLAQPLLDDVRVVRAVRQQDRAEDGLLGLDRVRRGGAQRAGRRCLRMGVRCSSVAAE